MVVGLPFLILSLRKVLIIQQSLTFISRCKIDFNELAIQIVAFAFLNGLQSKLRLFLQLCVLLSTGGAVVDTEER